jgi:hypothetical protein
MKFLRRNRTSAIYRAKRKDFCLGDAGVEADARRWSDDNSIDDDIRDGHFNRAVDDFECCHLKGKGLMFVVTGLL